MKKLKTGEVIQQVAADLFRKFGFEKTSMDEIARKAHKAKRSIYNHFSSKEDLFCASVQSELAHIRSRLLAVVEDDSQRILPRLRQYLLSRMELMAEANTLQVALKSNMLNRDDYGFEDLKKMMVDFNQWEHQAFKKVWYAKPSEEDPQIIDQQAVAFADMLQVTLNGLSYSFFVEDKYEQYKSSYEMLIDLIVNSVFQSFVSKYGKNEGEM
jgi:AcrR family transcriptional regulator